MSNVGRLTFFFPKERFSLKERVRLDSSRRHHVVIIPIITSEGGSRHENILGAALATGRPIPPSAPSASSATYPRDPSRSSRTRRTSAGTARGAAGDDRAVRPHRRRRRRARVDAHDRRPGVCTRAAGAGPPPGTRPVTCPRSPRRARARTRRARLDRRVWKRLAKNTRRLGRRDADSPHARSNARSNASSLSPRSRPLVCFEFETFLRRFLSPSAACRSPSSSSSAPRRRAFSRTRVAGWSHKRKKVSASSDQPHRSRHATRRVEPCNSIVRVDVLEAAAAA